MKITMISLERLHASPTNPRKKFDGIEELAESIAEKGVLQPILVRQHPIYVREWEVVAGERRFRASKLAKQKTVPAIVQDLSDLQALEIQLVENNQRRDVSPFEEAAAIQMLIGEHGRSVDDVAARLARPAAYVRRRMLLQSLHSHYRELWEQDLMPLGGCEILASSPTSTQESLLGRFRDDHGPFNTRSIRAAVLQSGHQLDRMPWELNVKYACIQPCDGCPFRSSSQPDMFGDTDEDDRCLDVSCYDSKLAAWADGKGIEVRTREPDRYGPPLGCVDTHTRINGQSYVELLGDVAKVLVPSRWGVDTYYDQEQATDALKAMGIEREVQPVEDLKAQRAADRERARREAEERDANIALIVEWAAVQGRRAKRERRRANSRVQTPRAGNG